MSLERSSNDRGRVLIVALLLVAGVVASYAGVASHEFVTYDDPQYVVQNPYVNGGLSTENLKWAFTRSHSSNWHPLTWLSHQLDCELFDLRAGSHHVVNLGLHALNAVLLLLALRALTNRLVPSAMVAALFAFHPLRVESVAWISERKDLLSGAFFLLALGAYARHARRPSTRRLALALALFALGLLAKPMLVTVPFVLLLLDVWPLGRFGGTAASAVLPSLAPTHPGSMPGETVRARGGFRLFLEKLPFFVLAALSSVVTVIAQRAGGSLSSFEAIPLGARVANAPVAVGAYLAQTFWPARLAYFYPHPALVGRTQALAALASALFLTAVSVLAWRIRQRQPHVFVGWFLFLGMLVPVLGLVQVGEQARADRYAYLPTIGLYVALVWSLAELVRARPILRRSMIAAMPLVLAVLALVTRAQAATWSNSESLYRHALSSTSRNYAAHSALASVLWLRGEHDHARTQFDAALSIRPDYGPALYGLGLIEQQRGNVERAIEHYRAALVGLPNLAAVHLNLGSLLAGRGETVEAALEFERALELDPEQADASYNLALLLIAHGDPEGAIGYLERALDARPGFAAARARLGAVLDDQGREHEAVEELRRALKSEPDSVESALRLAWILAASPHDDLRSGTEALVWATVALRGSEGAAAAREAFAAALAESGDFARAVEAQEEALRVLGPERAGAARERLRLYRSGEPYRRGP